MHPFFSLSLVSFTTYSPCLSFSCALSQPSVCVCVCEDARVCGPHFVLARLRISCPTRNPALALQDFEGVKSADRQNEARPPIHRTASMGQIQGRWLERKWKKKAESPKTMPALGETQKSVTLPSIQPEVIPHQTEWSTLKWRWLALAQQQILLSSTVTLLCSMFRAQIIICVFLFARFK